MHVVMYTYYFLATTLGKDAQRRKKWLWWGHYLTIFQMTQFVTMLTQARPTAFVHSLNRSAVPVVDPARCHLPSCSCYVGRR